MPGRGVVQVSPRIDLLLLTSDPWHGEGFLGHLDELGEEPALKAQTTCSQSSMRKVLPRTLCG